MTIRGRLLATHLAVAAVVAIGMEAATRAPDLPTTLIAAAVVAAAAAALTTVFVSNAFARPVEDLTSMARTMASGNLEQRADLRRKDELGDLGRALENLGVSLARTIREVTSERNRIAGVLAGMVEGVLVVDSTGHIVLVNPSLREILGIPADVAGNTVLEAVRSADLHEAIDGVLGGKEPVGRMLTVHGPPERTMEVRFSILRGGEAGSAAITGLVAVFHDVTELKRLEQVRRDFVANASHELKTPVAAILGASETLVAGAANDADAGPRFLDSIRRNASRLAALIEDLLDLSRMEARAGVLAPRAVRAGDALARAAAAFKDPAETKRIRIECVPADGVPAARGEPALLDRALHNLVQNAVRYTPEGGRVVLRARPDGDLIRFEVEDTGIGIPPQALPRIFERFYRVDPARSRALGGTGLGLAIVKHAVESMGGTVSVRSTPGHGSTFAFTLPIWTGP